MENVVEQEREEAVEEAQVSADQPQSSTEQAQTGQVAELTVQDLHALKAIIDVSSQRGAFKPNEMTTVGQVYNKLELFLESVAKQQQASQPAGE